jgi:hypothetical protein
MFHVEASSPGQRLFLIRLACGDGLRKPESMRDFAERVQLATGAEYEHSTIGMLERDLQGWRIKDVHAFAAVDPRGRGEAWLAFGEQEPTQPKARDPIPDPRPAKPATSADAARKRPRRR